MDGSARGAALVAEVGQIVAAGLQSLDEQVPGMELGSIEVRVQQLLRRAGMRSRHLVGLVGEVRLERAYFHCAACGGGQAPADAVWGIDGGMLTPGLARVAARAGLEAPFGQGASLVEEHLGVQLDEEMVRHMTERLGRLADADQAVLAPEPAPGPPPDTETLVVELDGGMVHLRLGWSELKVGRVAPLGPNLVEDPESGDRYLALGPSCYCAGVESCDVFWPRLVRAAVRAGLGGRIRRVVVLADGAEWIWHQARCHLGLPGVEVIEILDFYHASQHLAQAAAAVYGATSDVGGHWLDKQRHALRHEGGTSVLLALDRLEARDEAAATVVRLTRAYLAGHAQRTDYPAFRARLFPIGSGAIEGTVKNLIQARAVLAGMRWTLTGAHAVANLRALQRSPGCWTALWQSRPLRRAAVLDAAPTPPRHGADRSPTAPTAPPVPAPSTTPELTQPLAAGGMPPGAAVLLEETLPAPTAPQRRTRIDTDGKPWAKGKGYWHRCSLAHTRPA